jgi:hypothetical protein
MNLDNEARVMGATSGEEEQIEDGYVSSGMEDISAGGMMSILIRIMLKEVQ